MDTEADRIATNLRKGVLEYCVLALLSRRDMYGLELANALIERRLTASEGSLYPLLARMRTAGVVEAYWDSAEGSRARRYYAVTAFGRAQLKLFVAIWSDTVTRVEEVLKEERA